MLQTLTVIINQLVSKLLGVTLDVHAARQEALWLLEKVTGLSGAQLLVKDLLLSARQKLLLEKLLADRIEKKKPLQYILGSVPFCDLEILVESPILIPRPETEEWTWWLINFVKQSCTENMSILDMCAGSGCIGLALAKHLQGSSVLGVDICKQAVDLALKNKTHNHIAHYNVIESDLFNNIDRSRKFDMIVSNPPYLSEQEYKEIDAGVRDWEDRQALVTEDAGMGIYKRLIPQAKMFLKRERNSNLPALVCEIGPAQKEIIIAVLLEAGFTKAELINDLQGVARVAVAYI